MDYTARQKHKSALSIKFNISWLSVDSLSDIIDCDVELN